MTRNSAAIENSMPFVWRRMISGSTTCPSKQTTTAPTVSPTIQYEWFKTERHVH